MERTINPKPKEPSLALLIVGAIIIFAVVVFLSTTSYVVQPGTRGIKVTLGKAEDKFLPEGFGIKAPFITSFVEVNVRQRTEAVKAECVSSDLQQIVADVRVLYRVPEQSVVQIYKQYAGDPFDSLIAPRVQEALKEVTALQTAEQIVKNRESIKQKTLVAARLKIGQMLDVEDIVLRNIDLSADLERAIEAKMVAEQEADQAKFAQNQTQVEAATAIIKAKGDAEAIHVRGDALRSNPAFLRLQMVERWNGKAPLVVPSQPNNAGASMLMPVGSVESTNAP